MGYRLLFSRRQSQPYSLRANRAHSPKAVPAASRRCSRAFNHLRNRRESQADSRVAYLRCNRVASRRINRLLNRRSSPHVSPEDNQAINRQVR